MVLMVMMVFVVEIIKISVMVPIVGRNGRYLFVCIFVFV